MKVAELIAHLQTLPQDAEVVVYERGTCSECNPIGGDYYTRVHTSDIYHRAEVPVDGYRRPYTKNVVVI